MTTRSTYMGPPRPRKATSKGGLGCARDQRGWRRRRLLSREDEPEEETPEQTEEPK